VKIAIIDDDRQAREDLKRALQECAIDFVAQAEMQTFVNGEDFLEVFGQEEFRLVFLDICMDGINGIETALAIRQQDAQLPIVFLTSSADYALDGYRAFPEGYLLKPICKAIPQLMEILQRCLPKLVEHMFPVRINGRELQLNAERVAYVDVQGGHRVGGRRGSMIHLMTGESIAVDSSYADVSAMLKQMEFIECYNRLLVNLAAVDTLLDDRFRLKNGEQVPISRRLYRETAHEYMEYLLRK